MVRRMSDPLTPGIPEDESTSEKLILIRSNRYVPIRQNPPVFVPVVTQLVAQERPLDMLSSWMGGGVVLPWWTRLVGVQLELSGMSAHRVAGDRRVNVRVWVARKPAVPVGVVLIVWIAVRLHLHCATGHPPCVRAPRCKDARLA